MFQTPKPSKEECLKVVKDKYDLNINNENETPEEKPVEVRIAAPKTLKFPLSPPCQIPAVKSLPNPLWEDKQWQGGAGSQGGDQIVRWGIFKKTANLIIFY